VSNLFPQVFMVLDAVPPKPNAVPSKVERIILFPSVEAAVPAATIDFAGDTPATTDPQVGNPLTSANRLYVPSTNKNSRAFAREFPNLTN
jgi:hypothetical protein